MKEIKIDGKIIGGNSPCYTIAEAGANHDGNLKKAFKLIDAAKEAKADSIKFQTYTADKLTTKNAPKYWNDNKKNESQYDVFKKLDLLSKDDWKQIFEYAKEKKITCFSTPFDEESVDLLYKLGTPAFKISSADLTHLPLIRYTAEKKLPIFLSTGMASQDEIKDAVETIEDSGNDKIILMHCMTSYPTKAEDANLEIIRTLARKFPNYVIGYSDHTMGTTVSICSLLYGSKVIEKHFTFDNKLKTSPDHWLSLDTNGFSEMVNGLRIAEMSKGKAYREKFDAESEAVKYARRSIVAKKRIANGTKISEDMLIIKRPGTGIYPKFIDKLIGRTATRDIEEDIPIQWDYVSKS